MSRKEFTLPDREFLLAVLALVTSFPVNHSETIKDNGAFYQGTSVTNSDGPLTFSILYDFNVYIHKCSITSNCNYVIHNKRNNTFAMYENESEIPVDEKMQQVWMKKSRKQKFMAVAEKFTWHEARQRCLNYFGDLASITSKQEEEDLGKSISGFNFAEEFWFGINDIDNEGTFVWSDGRNVSYTGWNYGEPNNYVNEDCGILTRSMKWNDGLCELLFFFICRIPIV